MRSWLEGISNWIWREQPESDRRAAAVRFLPRIVAIVIRECGENLILLRASALTFTVILSLVPILALGTAVLKGLGAGDDLRRAVYNYIDTLERAQAIIPGAVGEVPGEKGGEEPAAGEEAPLPASLSGHLRRMADAIFDYVERTDFTKLGAFGVVGLIYLVVSVLSSIQSSLNAIWHVEEGRPLGRRIIDSLALMLLLPISVNLVFAVEATIRSPELFGRVQAVLPMAGLQHLLLDVIPLVTVTGAFAIFYRFIPNAQVRFLPAFVGATLSGVGWFLIQALYVRLQVEVARQNAIYGSFATLPLFAIWMYVGWLVFLVGAEVTFALQMWQRYQPRRETLSPMARLTLAFGIMAEVGNAFEARRPTNKEALARRLRRPDAQVEEVLGMLLAAGVLKKVDDPAHDIVPGGPPAGIDPAEVVGIILDGKEMGAAAHPLAEAAFAAAREAVAGKSLSGDIAGGGGEENKFSL